MKNEIDVSVYMLTYFHEKYVSEAIESVLAQKTQYNYELVISDDCSKDKTVSIIKEYENKYPDKIRVNCNPENIGIPKNIYTARCMCRGRYIVALSGDDYWIDENKLETEVTFLEEHPEYNAVFNLVELRDDGAEEAYETLPPKEYWNRPYTVKDFEEGNNLATHGFMMRNDFLTEEGRAYYHQSQDISAYVDDAVDMYLVLRKGPAYILGIATDAHRMIKKQGDTNNYNSRYSRLERMTHHIELYNGLYERFGDEIDLTYWYTYWIRDGVLGMFSSREFGKYISVLKTVPKKYKNIYLRSIPYFMGVAWRKSFGRICRQDGR